MFVTVLGSRGIMALRQLLLVPILMRAWGGDLYGQWLVVTAIPSFLAMSNMGLGTSAQIRISIDTAAGRKEEVSTILSTAGAMILAVGIVISLLVMWLIPWCYEADLQKVHIRNLDYVLLFLVISLFVRMFAQPMSGLWTGVGRPNIAGNAANVCSIAELLCCFIIPFSGGGPFELSLFLLVANILWLLWFGSKSVRLMRENGIGLRMPEWKTGKSLITSGIGYQLGALWQATLFQGSIVLANSTLGPVGAATWGSLRVLTRFGNQVLELVSQTLGPEFQLAVGSGDVDKLRRLYASGLVISLLISLFTATCVLVIAPTFFTIWTGGINHVSIYVWLTLAAALIPFSAWWLAGEYQRAIGQPWLYNLWGVLSAIVAVGMMWLMRKNGLLALSLGSLLFDIIMALVIVRITLRKFQISFIEILKIGVTETKLHLKTLLSRTSQVRS